MLRLMLLSLVCLGVLLLPACQSGKSAAAPAQTPSKTNQYQVIMWMLGDTPTNADLLFQRMRDANITAGEVGTGDSPEPYTSHGFGFYVENVHRIAFMFSTEHIYKEDRDAYVKTRDKKHLIRKPSLSDPAFFADAKQDIQSKIRFFAGTKPLLYNLGDECSVTSFASPMDYDFSPVALAAFRTWLKGQYGTLDALNAEWETKFATWDDVVPMTTYEIKDRERAGSENYSPWADHRTFMDISYAEAWRKFREYVREVDPKTPVGLEGLQHPSAFGGYDLWRLSQVVDWLEPYNIGESHAIFRSFMPEGAPIYSTVFEHDPKLASRRLWHLLLNGDKGNIIWASSEWFDYQSPEITPKPWVAGMGKLFGELRGPAPEAVMNASRDRAPIAILYSHPSVQVAWMLDSREDGDTWPNRHGSWDSVHGRSVRVRSSWCRLLEDLGLQYDFVSTEQLVNGTFAKRGYKVLILPAAYALSDKEAAAIESFAKNGATVIADYMPGLWDEHGKRRAKGVLDRFFGVSRPAGTVQQPDETATSGFRARGTPVPLGPAEPALSIASQMAGARYAQADTPGVVHMALRTWYLNISPIDYAKQRTKGEGGALRDTIGAILTDVGVKPAVRVTLAGGPPVGCEVITYHHGNTRYVAIMRNPEYHAGELGELGYGDNHLFEVPVQVTVGFGKAVSAKELLSGKTFKRGSDKIELALDPWKPLLIEVK